MDGEWRKLHTKSLNSPVWKDPDKWRFWTWCLLKATRTPVTEFVRKTAVDLQPGQLIYGRRMAHKETGLSEQTVVSCVKALTGGKDPSIHLEPYHNYTILTILKWGTYQNGHTTTIPQVPHNQPTSQPHPTHNEVENDDPLSPLPPRAHAPAKLAVKELRVSHTPTSACEDFETLMSPSYELVRKAYQEVTGNRALDASTREGAKALAEAVDCGDIDADDIPIVVKRGLSDPELKNQTLRGVANNFNKYLPKKTPPVAAAQSPPAKTEVEWVFKCDVCGREMVLLESIDVVEPSPIRCFAGKTIGNQCPGMSRAVKRKDAG
ncbi:MAG: hypothetical protein LUC93_00665 [Planctomycetaceae bacterium]|nr:hypothetical protein [Planctomycetaceae bacterium]